MGNVCSLQSFCKSLNAEEFVVAPFRVLCEAGLWTEWSHLGTVKAMSVCSVLSIEAQKFHEVIFDYQDYLPLISEYARHFVEELNQIGHANLDDLTQLDLTRFAFAGRVSEAPGK